MLLQGIGEIHRYTVPEHDRIGDLHHRALQVQRQQSIVSFSGGHLLRIESPQRRHVHHRAVDDFALEQRDALL